MVYRARMGVWTAAPLHGESFIDYILDLNLLSFGADFNSECTFKQIFKKGEWFCFL